MKFEWVVVIYLLAMIGTVVLFVTLVLMLLSLWFNIRIRIGKLSDDDKKKKDLTLPKDDGEHGKT